MSELRTWRIVKVPRDAVQQFIETWHYSGSINGCITDYCFAMYDQNVMKGAMFYGRMAMANQWRRFAESADDVIELRRLCCVDDTPPNAESYFIGRSLRLLKHAWPGNVVVSYADAEYGHSGTIYKAANFEYLGFQKGARVISYNGKLYHDKTIRTKYKGRVKPYAAKIAAALTSGEAVYKQTAGKHTYVYNFRKGVSS